MKNIIYKESLQAKYERNDFMKEKKKKIIIISIGVVAIIAIMAIIFSNIGIEKIEDGVKNNEIIPEEEISDKQLRETMINLYFVDQKNEIACEIRKIDSKDLLENPYMETMNLLLAGPKYDNLKTTIPKNTKINSIERNGDCLNIDFSKEFIDDQEENLEIQGLVINQIVNTMAQFTEINRVKISIEGENNLTFKNGNINFQQIFTVEN